MHFNFSQSGSNFFKWPVNGTATARTTANVSRQCQGTTVETENFNSWTDGCGMNITQVKTLDQEVTVFSQLSV